MGAELRWPSSPGAIAQIQRERKRRAVELALRAPFFRERLGGHRPRPARRSGRVGENSAADQGSAAANSGRAISRPVLRRAARATWSNTGAPAASPGGRCSTRARRDDMEYSIMCFRRAFEVVGATPEDLVHVSFPLGIHPVAHLYARAAEDLGIGTIWCGSGTQHAFADPARADPRPQADDLGRHGQLRPAPRQSRRSARLRSRRELGAQRSSSPPSRSRRPSARSSNARGAPRCPTSSA